ncbi:MAG: hypothetical protein VZQ47_05605 [Treponema sp.]|nr:hypothetical protein [Treponema sp.]MEE3435010.1 hypothetical protein [Treponema sp.]
MELIELTPKEYNQFFPKTHQVFNSVAFNELNAPKVDAVHYFVFKDSKVRLGICLGEKDGVLKSPFSAPFGGFSYNADDHKFKCVEEAVALLENFAKGNNRSVKITLPPIFYGSTIINETISSLTRSDFNLSYIDMNYQFYLKDFDGYIEKLDSKTRNKLNQSFQFDYFFEKLNSKLDADVERAYKVIKANREYRGFPLRMPLQAVLDTIKVVNADFFVLVVDGQDAAAAQVFHVAPSVVQVIYWGDAPGFSEKKVMNLLAYKVFEYYYNLENIEIVDIGPSTENGIPNHGLCEFKENIGCKTALKYTFMFG